MTKSDLFKTAHKIARLTKTIAGSYHIAFSAALKGLYAGEYSVSFEKMLAEVRGILECAGANWHLCRDLRSYVVYLNDAAMKLGYEKADALESASLRIGEKPSPAWCRFVVWAYASKGELSLKAMSMRPRKDSAFDIEDILSLGGGDAVYAALTR